MRATSNEKPDKRSIFQHPRNLFVCLKKQASGRDLESDKYIPASHGALVSSSPQSSDGRTDREWQTLLGAHICAGSGDNKSKNLGADTTIRCHCTVARRAAQRRLM